MITFLSGKVRSLLLSILEALERIAEVSRNTIAEQARRELEAAQSEGQREVDRLGFEYQKPRSNLHSHSWNASVRRLVHGSSSCVGTWKV